MATYYVDRLGNISTSPPKKKKKNQYYVDLEGNVSLMEQELDEELSPKQPTQPEKNKWWKNWLDKGAFSDGYQFGDVSKTILGTVNDINENVHTAVFDATENLIDTTAYGVGQIGGIFDKDFQDGVGDFIKKDLLKSKESGEWLANATNYLHPVGWAAKMAGIDNAEDTEENSILGDKADSLVQSAAHMVGSRALNMVGVPWQLTTGVNAFGSEIEKAFNEGATFAEAGLSGAITAGVEIGTESLFAGSGLGEKGLIDTSVLTKGIKNEVVKTLASYGVDIAAEGTEEVVAEFSNKIVTSIYKDEAPELATWEAFHDYVDAFIGGAAMGGGMNVGKVRTSLQTGTDYNTGLTQTEQKAVDKEAEKRIAEKEADGEKVTNKEKKAIQEQVMLDLDKGYISIDTIEEALGGETYSAYRDTVTKEDAQIEELEKQIKELEEAPNTVGNAKKYDALTAQLEDLKTNSQREQLKKRLGDEVLGIAQGSRLAESYNEKARRSQTFEADLTKYDDKQQEIVKKAADSGILNNTNRTHEFVDLIAKIAADKGVSFDFTNNAKLKESGFAVDGATVNGYVTKDGVTVNIQSAKALNSVVGHEITHVLEGTELYTELHNAVKQYAESKGEYKARMDAISKLYAGVKDADINAELTADLVGDYLFTDADFVRNLSVEHRNVFQKVYDEIKYLAKIATAGSKEARQLEKAKKAFEDAYRGATKNTAKDGGVKRSLSETTDGRIVAVVDNDILSKIDTSVWDKATKEKAQKAAANALKQFKDGIVVDGITRKVNRTSRREYTRSRDTETLYKTTPDVFADKMRAADIADDIVVATTNWQRDGGLKHPRNDNFVDFDHGTVLIVSGDAKYIAEVVVGITNAGDAVFYDVVDLTPTSFEIKNAESPTTATTQNAVGDIQGDSAEDNVAQKSENVNKKFSLTDNTGKELSKGQQDYFKDSKMRDENGNLMVMHHGSTETFTVFDKSKAKASGTFGKGFYFTDSVSHANQYGNSYDVYLNITNPLRGGTNDISKEQLRSFVEAVAEDEDYGIDNYGYGATVDSVTAAVFGKSDFEMLMDVNVSCIGDMSAAIELFNQVNGTNYDGIITPMETVAFYPEQIKSVDNTNPTADPDIHYSVSAKGKTHKTYGNYNVYGKDIALEGVPIRDDLARVQDSVQPTVQESDFAPTTEAEANALADETLWQMTDEDAPPVQEAYNDDFTDTTAIEPKALKDISKALKDVLYLDNKEVKAIGEVVQKYSTSEFPDKLDLFDELQAKFGTKETVGRNDETAAIKRVLRGYPINVSPEIKSDITDYTAFMRRNFGKVRFSKEGVPVDAAYQDLSDMFPEYFPDDITNASDQLIRISEVAGMDINETETFTLSDGDIMEAVDVITAEVAKYKEAQVKAAVEAEAKAAFGQIEDIPIREDITPAAVTPTESVATEDKPIKTVKDRLSAKLQNFQTELAANQQNRAASAASFDLAISRLFAEYSGKKNKDTKAANDILRRIDRLRTRKGNVDADYAKRINDLEARVEKTAEEVRTGASATEQAAMRREVHTAIVDNIKTTYGERGYDFDKVLENAKDLSTFSTVDNIPQRVMEKALGYKEGQILADLTVNKVAQNETEGIKWLNSFTDRKSGLLAQISKQYSIKPGSKESAAAQMYAEGFYVNDNEEIIQYGDAELAKDFPNATVRENIKGLAKDPRIRKIYDETLAAINESRARNAYPEIQRLDNYFLHFRAQTDTFSRLGIPFNPKDIKAKDLPTDLNGVTADLKPGQPYFASAMHRKGKRTSFDLLGGLEQYLTSAKDQIYHIDDIQTLRALRNYIADTYGQAKGLENLDTLTEEEAEAKIKEVYDSHLSTFSKFLNEEANVIAGKTSLTDRGIEGIIGRRGISFLDTINRQVGANMVGFNVSSSLTNFLAAVQGMAKTNKFDFVKAMAQTTANKLGSIVGKTDGFAEQSPVVIRRKGAERFHRTPWQKASDAGYVLMSAVDDISTEVVARAKYNELTRKGMDAQQAHVETDKWVSRLMGDRSLGQQPQLYNSKMLGMFTKFQLEVRNQLDSQFYDTIQEAKVSSEDIQNGLARNAVTAAKVGSTLFQLAVLQHVFGKAFESVAGYNPAFDIIDVLIKTFGWDDDEEDEDTALDNVQEGFLALMGDLPYTSTFTGGRIPISSALPIEQLVTGKDDYGNEKSRWDTVKEAAPYYVLPAGYGQIKKTTQGLGMFDDDLPIAGSYTDSGNLRFPVEDTPANRLQAGLFGQWASENARDYFDNERAPLKEKQIQEYVDLDLPISEYWKYREGLKGLETTEEKLQYIDSLDLPTAKKNIMANNVTDRKNPIDMTDFDLYGSLDEFDFATKYPEKYAFFENSGITYAAYANGDEDAKRAYNWAYENPGKYTVSKAVAGDVVEYRRYISEINDLTADKDEYGESISGSAKDKKIEYINGLNLDYGQKVILFRSIYDGKADRATYDAGIVEYLNSREDISYEEKVTILKELDFTVLDDGTVRW